MTKAILELEMPESCKQCKLGHYDELAREALAAIDKAIGGKEW